MTGLRSDENSNCSQEFSVAMYKYQYYNNKIYGKKLKIYILGFSYFEQLHLNQSIHDQVKLSNTDLYENTDTNSLPSTSNNLLPTIYSQQN